MRSFDSATSSERQTVSIRGVEIDAVTEEAVVREVLDAIDTGQGGWVATPNLEIVRQACRWPDLVGLLNEATWRVADGITLVWISRIMGRGLPDRVCGSDLISSLSAGAVARGRSIYLLGGARDTARRAAHVLARRHPELRICGTECATPGFDRDPEQLRQIRDRLMRAQPDIVFVALGFPKAERLIESLRQDLPATWWLGVGIAFSYLCGEIRRAPTWMQRIGLESLVRLLQEPRRLAPRYLLHGPPFAAGLLATAVQDRWWSAGSTLRLAVNSRER